MQLDALTSTTVVVRDAGFSEASVDDEIVAFSFEKGVYAFNSIGSRIWHLLANPISVANICNTLVSEYQVDPETCEREVLDLLEKLRVQGMVHDQSETNLDPLRGYELTAIADA